MVLRRATARMARVARALRAGLCRPNMRLSQRFHRVFVSVRPLDRLVIALIRTEL
jgi:hypothetical protein